jgi:hypothetical protein
MSNHTQQMDPCAQFGPVQKRALVWFVVIILIGSALVCKLARVDRWMYDNNGEFLNYKAYKDNRTAATSVASEPSDPRMFSDLNTARTRLAK